MTGKGPVAPDPICQLITHQGYAVEMVDSIIKETDLGASGLFDLSRVCLRHLYYAA